MVKVISLAPEKQASCQHCKTQLSYAYTDMVFSVSTDYTGGRDEVASIECPVCHKQVYVSTIFGR